MMRLRSLTARACVLIGVAALATSPSLPVEQVERPSTASQIAAQISNPLSEMSTGSDQEVIVSGSSAQSRNARIPVVSGQTRFLKAYAPISPLSDTYNTALKCLTQAVYYEAANESRQGKQAVAQVVLNRMRHPAYPNSVCGVVYQGVNNRVCQFSFTCDGSLLRQPIKRQWSESQAVAQDALDGKQLRIVGTATHYHADYVVPKWAYKLAKLKVVGTHIFYRFPGSAGEPDAFGAKWQRSERIPAINWDRFSASIEDAVAVEPAIEESWVPGLTVAPDKKDRHAKSDVGGRIDTTKQWRLSIPDPTSASGSYQSAIEAQSEVQSQTQSTTPENGL